MIDEESNSMMQDGHIDYDILKPGAIFGNLHALGGPKQKLYYYISIDPKVELIELDT